MNSDYFVIEEIENKEVFSNQPDLKEEMAEKLVEEKTRISSADVVMKSAKLAKCPSCGGKTLKVEGGCHSCINKECGYSKCDL